ncbi:MAG TPA: glutathione S-transferase [Burkholderiaceae bacterium]|nr:glutathione S-transferase [Burkholderiaceae bacterium]
MKVLGRASSINVRKVLWTAAEAGLAFEREDWGIGFRSTREETFLALNPNALVPVLIDDRDGDFVLWESNTICRYLAAQAGRTDLLPATPRARAEVERWMDWQAGELNNAWRYAFMALVRLSPAHTDDNAIAASAAEWNRHMALLDAHLERTGAHVAGADFTLADIVLGVSAQRWFATPIERPALRAVQAWFARVSTRPAYVAQAIGAHP